MAIQHRRGNYVDFDKSKMVTGEFAFVINGDPNTPDGTGVYASFGDGNVQRLVTYEEAKDKFDQILNVVVTDEDLVFFGEG